MIIYVFYGSYMRKTFLPVKVAGFYPIYYADNRLLMNIEESEGKWIIKCAPGFSFFKNKEAIENNAILELYSTYAMTSNNNSFYMVALPYYSENTFVANISGKGFSAGAKESCELTFRNKYVSNVEFSVTMSDTGRWAIQTNSNNVYLNDKLVRSSYLLAGDTIFCFGLKIVCLGTRFMVFNMPSLSVRNNVFMEVDIPPIGEITPSYELMEDSPLYTKKEFYQKSPRFALSPKDSETIIIDEFPSSEKKEELPAILTLGPQLSMLAVSLLSSVDVFVGFAEGTVDTLKFITSAVTIGTMIAGIMIWPMITRIFKRNKDKSKEKKKVKKYLEYLEKKRAQINSILDYQRKVLFEKNLPLTGYVEIIEQRKPALWERDIDDLDFLSVWLGIGKVKTDIKLNLPGDGFKVDDDDKLLVAAKSMENEFKYLKDVPYTMSLVESQFVSVIGDTHLSDKFLDNIFLQIMTFHSYADLKIIVYTKPENADRWEYLKNLNHCWNNEHTTRYFATNIEEFNELITDIDAEFDSRKGSKDEEASLDDNGEQKDEKNPYVDFKPYYLIFTDDIQSIRNTSLIKKILNYKKNLGFSLLVESTTISELPGQMTTFIIVNEKMSALFNNDITVEDSNQFQIDFNTYVDMYRCSFILSNTPILLEKGKYELPKSLSFLQMYNVGKVEQLNSLDRWKNNNPVNSLSVPVGIDQNGEIFKMDIHEKVYGPHGLVAGTTGSGKSEWIITYILSLAVNFNPDEMQFVLIDYKGGGLAMSFENKDMGIKLPHLAGTITNLDKSAINRSIASLESELKRRQTIFNDAREQLKEGQMDIYKYQQFYRKGLLDKPLSHLLLISDEFAELKQQQPEFLDQLVSIARVGRSLGVHLILATQKPSGVVNDQIWSNSRFKVCLRVQDKADSNEILKKPDAAYLKQTGAFYLEVGNDEYYNLGQSAWAGAKYYPSDVVKHTVDQSVQSIDNVGKITNYYDDSKEVQNVASEGEELLNIVKYIDKIASTENFVKQQLWLPNIPEVIYLDNVKKKYDFKFKKLDFTTVIGEYDEPRKQEQNIFTIDLGAGNIAIVGQPGAGKELLLSTIIFSSVVEHTPQEINYYILDFGAETLRKFAKFPHVGEVVFQDDMERVAGVIQLVYDEIEKRKQLFQDYNGSLEYYNAHSGEVLPLICLVINGFDVFSESLARLADGMTPLFRDAPRYGIIFILSSSAQNTFRTKTLQYFNRFIVMNLQDESQYRNLTNCRKGLMPSNLYGRGICKTTDDDDSYCEFQTAKITDPDKELLYLKEVATSLSNYYKIRAKSIITIPDNITSEDLTKYVTTVADIPIGYNFYEKDIAKLDLTEKKFFSIVTNDMKTLIPFIYGLTNVTSKIPNTVVRVIDCMKVFEKPVLDIKLFNEDLKVVFAAIAKDVETRTDTQPLAINFIIGAASLKNVLDKTGQEFADKMFNGIANCKQNIFILIDDYKKFKLLKLQPWYSHMDLTNGIWFGPGIDNQSVLVSNELSQEDKKYNYEGMAYLIKDGNYTLIKTMMDGDD